MARKTLIKQSEKKVSKRRATGAPSPSVDGRRAHLRRLVDELPEAEMGMAERFLVFLRGGGVTQELEDRLDVELAREALDEMRRTGEAPVPYEQVRREVGL